MQSDKYICVREVSGEVPNVVIVDLESPNQPSRRPIKAEAAIVNPRSMVIALKAGSLLQIFNIELRSKMKSYQIEEEVKFWKWISVNQIVLVTNNSVFHWSIEGTSEPVKVFDRHETLNNTQIIDYQVSEDRQWVSLVGITKINNRVVGKIQLYSIEKQVSQPFEGHSMVFASFKVNGATTPSTLCCVAMRNESMSKLHIVEVGGEKRGNEPKYQRTSVDIYFPQEATSDFPLSMQIGKKYGVIYLITQMGYIHVYDLESGAMIYMNRISSETIFVTTQNKSNNGIIGVNRKGQVLTITINEETVIPYIVSTLKNLDLAISLTGRANLPGAEDLFITQFNRYFEQGNYKQAAIIASNSPGQCLRTAQTINMFKQAPQQQQGPAPILQYFSVLLDKGKLNALESVELATPVVQQGRTQLIERWLKENKLECSEELGDLVRRIDTMLALSVYLRATASEKVVQCFAELGQFGKIIAYSKKFDYKPNYPMILTNLIQMNPEAVTSFVQLLLNDESGPLIDITAMMEILLRGGMIQNLTQIMLDVLKNNKEEEGPLQTRLLEINLNTAPRVADAIMAQEVFSHYDRAKIAYLCERQGLFQRALEHYEEIGDIKRCVIHTEVIPPEWLINYFERLTDEYFMQCLKEMLTANIKQSLQVVVQIAAKYTERFEIKKFVSLFENFNSFEGVYYYLGSVISQTQEEDIHYKYIQAATKIGEIQEVEHICRTSDYYNPEKVKNFLKSSNLSSHLPLIIVCDRFDFVEDLTRYLYKNSATSYIETYVQKINPNKAPQVIGTLLDLDVNEDYIKELIMSIRGLVPVNELSLILEKRNRLKILLPMLEKLIEEGDHDSMTHSALAKIYIDANRDPENFLLTNEYYDSKIVGAYCEKRDPHLAFVAYKRGKCDKELIDLTNRNSMFKHQARYLVERQDAELWKYALNPENEFRDQLVNQVTSTALPESQDADEVSVTVRAFMQADLPNELIDLLEKIMLKQTPFSENPSLQNLLILTAIKADKSRVMEYVTRLDNYDGSNIANVSIGEGLYEEAFTIFKKFEEKVSAIQVLLNNIMDMPRAVEWAELCDEADVWSTLADAQCDRGFVVEGMQSYIKANNPTKYEKVIEACFKSGEHYEELINYLQMCRRLIKEQMVETELVYAFARTERLADLEDFINSPNLAKIQLVGDRCYDERLYKAAKLLYINISNYGRLASTLVKLEDFHGAVEAARKANTTHTWKEVNHACIDFKEFRLAQIAGLHIIIQADELEELVQYYENRGHFEEVTQLLEAGLGLEQAHNGMFTTLGVLYSKYNIAKLMEHIKLYSSRINIPRLIRQTETMHQWNELCHLYVLYEEFDNSVKVMIQHPIQAWEHTKFKDIVQKVSTIENYYKSLHFYLEQHPLLVVDLLVVLTPRIDHSRVVMEMRKAQHLPLVKPYLVSVQQNNVKAVNEALNQLYIEDGEYENLQVSIDTFDNFDQIGLARALEENDLLEFRRISAYIYKRNGKFSKSVELSKKDQLYKDAMKTACASKTLEIGEQLLAFFVENELKECFGACLYMCYDIIRPDVALELAWRFNIVDFAMPFLIQTFREYSSRIEKLEDENKELKEIQQNEQNEQFDDQNELQDPNQDQYFGLGGGLNDFNENFNQFENYY
ncbi:clathrin heavy chain [Anaeramoeba flamelloides]|uniref:Clathrin heavy chain n=1 Tax=Anaeramoeba flamelloides TaxID=1746091 RepID=A0ABQ8Y2L8_9EUKA|nr:clathrin heavy chain [Anaeramoeba flamelloides]